MLRDDEIQAIIERVDGRLGRVEGHDLQASAALERVDLSELGDGPLVLDMKPPDGIGGLDPREHASAGVGERNVELAAETIGNKARQLLESLPEQHRTHHIESISPEH